MKTLLKYFIALFSLLLFYSCGEDLPWQNEQYEKMIYVLCNSSTHVFDAEYYFDGSEDTQNISILCSGTHDLDVDIDITLRDDTVLYDLYNKTNFDIDTPSYAKLFSKEKYSMPVSNVTIKAGDFNALIPVQITKENLAGLSPDSIYFIPLAIDKVSAYSKHPDNYNLLFRVYARNAYASMMTLTEYKVKGEQHYYNNDGNEVQGSINFTKIFHPISADEIRCLAGIINVDNKNKKLHLRSAMVVKINEDNTLTLRPFYDGEEGLILEQLDVPNDLGEDEVFLYDNTYEPDSKRLKMYYRYKVWRVFNEGKDNEYWGYSDWYTFKEIDELTTDLDGEKW